MVQEPRASVTINTGDVVKSYYVPLSVANEISDIVQIRQKQLSEELKMMYHATKVKRG